MAMYEISKWLQDLFQDEVVPEFEKSSESIALLSKIIALNKETDNDVEEMIKIDKYSTEFYTKKSDEICESFNSFSIKNLPLDIQDCIKNISTVALQMNLKAPTLTNFLLSSSFLESKLEEYAESQLIKCFTLSKLSMKTTEIIQKNAAIERNLETLERVVLRQSDAKTKLADKSLFFRKKIQEYKKQFKKQENQLTSVGYTSSLKHSELVEKGEVVHSLEKELENITTKLNSYQNLPPNEVLAGLKVEEAQVKLLQLQKDFQSLL